MKRRSISISDETWLDIKLLAVTQRKTPSQIVEEACRALVDKQHPKGQGRKP